MATEGQDIAMDAASLGKRKAEEEMESVHATKVPKRPSRSENECGKIIKSVSGELLSKNKIDINNKSFFLFKFMINNLERNYYGEGQHFYNMSLNAVYDMTLLLKNRKMYIGEFKKSAAATNSNAVRPSLYLHAKDFEDNSNASVLVRLIAGFKMIDCGLYKMICNLTLHDENDRGQQVQIECTASACKYMNAVKNSKMQNDEDLLGWFHENENKTLALHRIKCQKTNGTFMSLAIQNLTQIEVVSEEERVGLEEPTSNVSRSNKMVAFGTVRELSVEHAPLSKVDRYIIKYKLDDHDEWLSASYFNDNRYDQSGAQQNAERFKKLEIDLNQLTEMIENDIITVRIFVVGDLEKKLYNLLGITKCDVDSNAFEAI
ncbi:late expression factor 3 [Lymantria dispar multiple nucleopolyhedrovirus]|uniref:Late expression factor 3 n=1 Tax=Lymantria dispar multicapsid nuclear polyhedrosis virus TaxID=10449 RepID=Q9YMP6_NPVLD|nr:late expression factor 3 [Lymantria dispar multiple nucleopolyhedrovirus]AAC70267.1 late expression factor 3 [Lymantria dispar multiple nucleopolyhedrovirus]WAK98430.1 LDMNPV-ORF81 Ld-lef3 [Lymantria dispar multiple nucleopolyhedrovirus]